MTIDYGKRWKNIKSAVLHILSLKSVDCLSSTIEQESKKGVRHVMELAESNETIDPLGFGRFISMNLIPAIAFNIPSAKNVDDPMFKEIVKIMFPVLKISEILFGRDRKMQRYVDKELFPFMRQIIKDARESSGDSLVKEIDSVRKEYDIDEMGIIVLMGEILHARSDSVYEEVNAFIKRHEPDPTFADREELPYFIAFEKECIRFRAVVDIG
ncbi:cytochrome P450 [Rhizopus microsporus ATCC 52813]|uniref:Cytochrome P450 n=1 Tax=Rhizopus microsporus ATCC 52813 TaxID=1340429 RepID=A0A2G4SLA4_RHIZD|nr:cytochrome P450 [Rhizopus microsporus ATCC 52813]PHZ09551.1 cytochrome P450 [Rhizopus microsporus ATCC 52813]